MIKNFIKLSYVISMLATTTVKCEILSDLIDEPFYRLCNICEKALIDLGEDLKELNDKIVHIFGKRTFLRNYIHHNDRDFIDYCEIFYFIKNFKDTVLSEEEQQYMLHALSIALFHFNLEKNCCHIFISSQNDANFVKSLNLENYYNKCISLRVKMKLKTSNSSSESKENTPIPSTKVDSCALL